MNKKFLGALVSLFIVASSVLALNGFSNNSSALTVDDTPDKDTVAITWGGSFSESAVRTNAAKGDVPKVMAAFGISQSEMNGFVSGVVWKDGHITVGDKTVATHAITAGRWNNPTSDMTKIAGTDRAYKMSTSHFTTDGQTAFIKMVNGQFSFAIIKPCGNPVTATPMPKPPTPTYSCNSFVITEKINRTSFRFVASASAGGGAKITSYRYEFGDGQSATSTGTVASHTYSAPGTYTARATALVSVNGKTVEVTNPKCTVPVVVTTPPTTPPPATPTYDCTSLTATEIDKEARTYSYNLVYNADDSVALRDVTFNFGDGAKQTGVKPDEINTITHSYASAGSFTTTTTLYFTVGTAVKTKTCQVKIDIPKPNECKPNIPVGDDRCKVTPPVTQVVAQTPSAPLPSTGPTDLAVGGVGIGSIAGAGYYWRASRRNLINKLLNR